MCVALITSCSTPRRKFDLEAFGSTTTHARNYAVVAAKTCGAVRRALLSQGFLIAVANAEGVNGRSRTTFTAPGAQSQPSVGARRCAACR